jgi:hypothetical protein
MPLKREVPTLVTCLQARVTKVLHGPSLCCVETQRHLLRTQLTRHLSLLVS